MKIGINQILRTTPVVIRRVKTTIVYTVAGSLPFTGYLATRFGVSPLEYAELCGVVILLTKSVSMLFGVPEDADDDKKEVMSSAGPGGSTLPPPGGLPPKP